MRRSVTRKSISCSLKELTLSPLHALAPLVRPSGSKTHRVGIANSWNVYSTFGSCLPESTTYQHHPSFQPNFDLLLLFWRLLVTKSIFHLLVVQFLWIWLVSLYLLGTGDPRIVVADRSIPRGLKMNAHFFSRRIRKGDLLELRKSVWSGDIVMMENIFELTLIFLTRCRNCTRIMWCLFCHVLHSLTLQEWTAGYFGRCCGSSFESRFQTYEVHKHRSFQHYTQKSCYFCFWSPSPLYACISPFAPM